MSVIPDFRETETIFRGFKIATMVENAQAPFGLLEAYTLGVANGQIEWLVPDERVAQRLDPDRQTGPEPSSDGADPPPRIVEGHGRLLTPGLIDCHTHLVYGGNRADEWARRMAGESYESISASGGGILSTVAATRAACETELFESAGQRLGPLIAEGVTTIEIKSGYGLDLETELKMLAVALRLGQEFPVEVETTLLAAHAVPPEYASKPDAYLDLVCGEIMPAASGICTAVDVFCETIAFSLEQSRYVLETARRLNLKTKIHAEQLSHTGAAAMASSLGAMSVDHLEYLSNEDCAVLAEHGTVATLLPGAFYCLRESQKPPVAELIAREVPVAIATDCNPGSSPVVSILLIAHLACTLYGLTPEQSLAAITRNAARALGLFDSRGTIEVGKRADFAIWNCRTPFEIFYQLGGNPCEAVYRSGVLV